MKTSVAMCTYNGAKYIREQLDSILNQSHPVAEIVICDDGSTDATIAILEQYVSDFPNIIRYSQNEKNKGFKQNFIDTMLQCRGDIIFLSDQDDVWRSDKVTIMLNYFEAHPNIDVLFTDGRLINEKGDDLGESMFERVGFDKEKQSRFRQEAALDIIAWCNRSTGATMAIRNEYLRNLNLQKYGDIKGHDFLLTLLALRDGKLNFMNNQLIKYRIHSSQTISLEAFDELFFPVEQPSPLVNYWEYMLTREQKHHCEFIRKRVSFKHSWFGMYVCMYVCMYVRMYGARWYRYFKYDYLNSWRHSLYRIKQKFRL